jgi:hypothetical protein
VRDPAVGFKLTTKEKEFNHKERKGYFFVTFVRFVVSPFFFLGCGLSALRRRGVWQPRSAVVKGEGIRPEKSKSKQRSPG